MHSRWAIVLALAVALCAPAAAADDWEALWDHAQPAASEQRFRQAAAQASGDARIILLTQAARTLGLRRDFDAARRELAALEPALAGAGAAARAHHALELGRTNLSATHPSAQRTSAARDAARQAHGQAMQIAQAHGLDDLLIDAQHMMAFVETEPALQRQWNEKALARALASTQPRARQWEASLRHNLGLDLHRAGQLAPALAHFQQAAKLREAQAPKAERTRIAHWMVAWTLRGLGRHAEALALQQRLEQECEAAGQPDPYVFDELALLYARAGDEARARQYRAKAQAARPPG